MYPINRCRTNRDHAYREVDFGATTEVTYDWHGNLQTKNYGYRVDLNKMDETICDYYQSGLLPTGQVHTLDARSKPVSHERHIIDVYPGKPFTIYHPDGVQHTIISGMLTNRWESWAWPLSVSPSMTSKLKYPVLNGYGNSNQGGNPLITKGLEFLPDGLKDSRLLNLPQVGLLTFLAELRDIRRLTELFKFHRSPSDISDKYLGVSFGALPLVSDIKSMYNSVSKLTPAIDSWNDFSRNGKIRSIHHTFESYDSGKITDQGLTSMVYGTFPCQYLYKYTYQQKCTQKVHVYIRPRPIAGPSVSLYSSLWGLNKPLATAWNLIPFSFVADWFANIGDLINDFEQSEPELGFDIVDACVSSKTVTYCMTDIYRVANGEERYIGSSTKTDELYKRERIDPALVQDRLSSNSISEFEFIPELSGTQISLSAALIHQRWFT